MKNNKINSETILALSSTCCLLCMKYYETIIYYRNINRILDTLYFFVMIPLFFFFISACFFTILIKLFNIHFAQNIKGIYRLIDIIIAIVYVIFLVLKAGGYITIGNMPFVSIYWIIFIAWGFIFSIDLNGYKKEGE